MKLATLFILAAIGFQGAEAKESVKIYESISSDYQATLQVASLGKDEMYLLRFNGYEHPFDGMTFLYEKRMNSKNPNEGYAFHMVGTELRNFQFNGKQTLINGTLVPYAEVYLQGKPATKMVFSHNEGTGVIEKAKVEYALSQGVSESKVAAKKLIAQAQEKLKKTCKTDPSINVDWAQFEKADQKTTPGMLKAYMAAMSNVCERDKDYLQAVKDISTIIVTPSTTRGKDNISVKGDILKIQIDKDVPNITQTAYQKLLDVL